MSTPLRVPFLIAAAVLGLVVVGVETGSNIKTYGSVLSNPGGTISQLQEKLSGKDSGPSVDNFKQLENVLSGSKEDLPGFAAGSLVNVDLCLLVTVLFMVLPLCFSADFVCRIQGPLYIIFGIITIISSFILIIKAILSIIIMIALLLAIPFGTIIYMIKYAFFDTSKAAVIMHTLFGMKLLMSVFIVAASELFLKNIGLLLMVATSFICMLIVNVLHGFPPRFLVCVTDAIAAIIVSVVAIIWAIVFVVGGIIGTIKAVKTTISL